MDGLTLCNKLRVDISPGLFADTTARTAGMFYCVHMFTDWFITTLFLSCVTVSWELQELQICVTLPDLGI